MTAAGSGGPDPVPGSDGASSDEIPAHETPTDEIPAGEARGSAEPGLEPLQQAARQLISAARAFLDAAEAVVDDPEAVGVVVSAVSESARDAVRVAGAAGRRAAQAAAAAAGGERDDADRDQGGSDDGDDGPVTSIPVR